MVKPEIVDAINRINRDIKLIDSRIEPIFLADVKKVVDTLSTILDLYERPVCPKCGRDDAMMQRNGEWVCHHTHVLEEISPEQKSEFKVHHHVRKYKPDHAKGDLSRPYAISDEAIEFCDYLYSIFLNLESRKAKGEFIGPPPTEVEEKTATLFKRLSPDDITHCRKVIEIITKKE